MNFAQLLGQARRCGKNCAFVKPLAKLQNVTAYYISQNGVAARGTTVEPGEDEPDSNAF
jgi:hypothetical protein